MGIPENVYRIMDAVDAAAAASGRQAGDIALVAATKMNSASRVQEAVAAGIKHAGENRVQELLEKKAQGAYEGADLHFIGHLQTNKVRQIVGQCRLIQSVDSKALLEQISKRAAMAGICQAVLLEVNISREAAKSGVMAEEVDELLAYAATLEAISVEGLMTIPRKCEKKAETRKFFNEMYNLFVDTKAKKYDNVSMQVLSMGMSSDFDEAILAGSNMIRVGSAIFGERDYSRR